MTTFCLGWIGMPEALLIMVVLLVFFGAKKLPELAKGLGQGIREFKKATSDVTQDFNRSLNDNDPPAPPAKQIKPASEPADAVSQQPKP
jgi:sec-independent protein translocase protein TatA